MSSSGSTAATVSVSASTSGPGCLALTCGDPAGVGPEVLARWLESVPAEEAATLAIHGPARWLARLPHAGVFHPHPVGPTAYEATPGRPDEASARVALLALQSAASSDADGVVTGPVSKACMASVGWAHPGQTEFFAAAWGGEPVMAFCGGRLRVALLTWHIPFAAVPTALTPERFARTIEATVELCAAAGLNAAAPRIAVCGLNPHAGEDGLLGAEERDVIDPILHSLRARHPGLSRALPGDTVFMRQLQGEFDAVVALYHDQGLAPLKTIEFDQAVNVTLGLPRIRTSPDHGTGFSIAGRGLASSTSFGQAVRVARALVAHRRLRATS